jgi:Beta-galactosidase
MAVPSIYSFTVKIKEVINMFTKLIFNLLISVIIFASSNVSSAEKNQSGTENPNSPLPASVNKTIDLLTPKSIIGSDRQINERGTLTFNNAIYFDADLPDNLATVFLSYQIKGDCKIEIFNKSLTPIIPLFWQVGRINGNTTFKNGLKNIDDILKNTFSSGRGLLSAENHIILKIAALNPEDKIEIKQLQLKYSEVGKPAFYSKLDNCRQLHIAIKKNKDFHCCQLDKFKLEKPFLEGDDKLRWVKGKTLDLSSLPSGKKEYNNVLFYLPEADEGIIPGENAPGCFNIKVRDGNIDSVNLLMTGSRLNRNKNKGIILNFIDGSKEYHLFSFGWNISNWYKTGFPISGLIGNANLPKVRQIKIPSKGNRKFWNSFYHYQFALPTDKKLSSVTFVFNGYPQEKIIIKGITFVNRNRNLKVNIIPEDYSFKKSEPMKSNIIIFGPDDANASKKVEYYLKGKGKLIKTGENRLNWDKKGRTAYLYSVSPAKYVAETGQYQLCVKINGQLFEGPKVSILFGDRGINYSLHYNPITDPAIMKNTRNIFYHINKGGYDGIRFQVPWNFVEDDNGKIDFTRSDQIMDACADNDLQVEYFHFAGFSHKIRPGKFHLPKLHSTSLSLGQNGLPGDGMAPSLWDQKFISAKKRIYRKISEHYKNHKAFSELYINGTGPALPKFIGERSRVRSSASNPDARKLAQQRFFGFEECAQKAFREYLAYTYKNIETLNKKFNLKCKSFAEIEIPRDKNTYNFISWQEYLKFRTESVNKFAAAMINSCLATETKKSFVLGMGDIARFNDIAHGSLLPACVKKCKQAGGHFSEDGSTVFSDAFVSIRYAQKYGVPCTFESSIASTQEDNLRTVWNSILLQIPTVTFVSYSRGSLFNSNPCAYKAYTAIACNSEAVYDDLAVYIDPLISMKMGIITRYDAAPPNRQYMSRIDGLINRGFSYDLSSENFADAFSKKVIIDGVNPAVAVNTLKRIIKYIENGGVFIAFTNFDSFSKYKNLKKYLGIEVVKRKYGGDIYSNGKKTGMNFKRGFQLRSNGNVRSLGKWNNNPKANFAIEKMIGKGKFIMIGAKNLSFVTKPESEFLAKIIEQNGAERKVITGAYGVQRALFRGKDRYSLFLMNLTPEDRIQDIIIRDKELVKFTRNALNTYTNQPAELVAGKDVLVLNNISLPSYEIIMLELKQQFPE